MLAEGCNFKNDRDSKMKYNILIEKLSAEL